jgi:hypothetical protein
MATPAISRLSWLPASRPHRRYAFQLRLNDGLESTGSECALLLHIDTDLAHSILPDGVKKQGPVGSTALIHRDTQPSILVVRTNEPVGSGVSVHFLQEASTSWTCRTWPHERHVRVVPQLLRGNVRFHTRACGAHAIEKIRKAPLDNPLASTCWPVRYRRGGSHGLSACSASAGQSRFAAGLAGLG